MDRNARLSIAVSQEFRHKRTALDRVRLRLSHQSPMRRLPGHRQEVDMRVGRLRGSLTTAISVHRRRTDSARHRLMGLSPERRLGAERAGLESRRHRLDGAGRGLVRDGRATIHGRRGNLEALSPLRTLERGYSITLDAESGTVVAGSAQLQVGQRLRTRFAAGEGVSRVEEIDTGEKKLNKPPERGALPPGTDVR